MESTPQATIGRLAEARPTGVAPLHAPPALPMMLRLLAPEDEQFVAACGLPVGKFRRQRRRIFRRMLRSWDRSFAEARKRRMANAAAFPDSGLPSVFRDDMLFKAAYLELQAALVVHCFSATAAYRLVRGACGQLEAWASHSSFASATHPAVPVPTR